MAAGKVQMISPYLFLRMGFTLRASCGTLQAKNQFSFLFSIFNFCFILFHSFLHFSFILFVLPVFSVFKYPYSIYQKTSFYWDYTRFSNHKIFFFDNYSIFKSPDNFFLQKLASMKNLVTPFTEPTTTYTERKKMTLHYPFI